MGGRQLRRLRTRGRPRWFPLYPSPQIAAESPLNTERLTKSDAGELQQLSASPFDG